MQYVLDTYVMTCVLVDVWYMIYFSYFINTCIVFLMNWAFVACTLVYEPLLQASSHTLAGWIVCVLCECVLNLLLLLTRGAISCVAMLPPRHRAILDLPAH